MPDTAVPGQILANTSTHLAGPGTHVYEANILASLVGAVITIPSPNRSSKPTISIPRHPTDTSTLSTATNTLPSLLSTVLCRVLRVQQRQLNASILLTDPTSTAHTITPYTPLTSDELQYQAILRREDVRAYDKDKIVMNDMYRVGDIIRATIISLGDERNYYISTAGNELGVVIATSEAGNVMVPSSWREMRDVVTGKGEGRKVAKPA